MGKFTTTLLLSIFILISTACSSDNDEPKLPSTMQSNEYCIIFYVSGGDPEHDLIFNEYKADMLNYLQKSDIEITWLFKSSNTDDKVLRYYSEDNNLVLDKTWSSDSNFAITTSDELTEFLNWSNKKFPNKKYILVTAGHGNTWTPTSDNPDSRSLMYDGITKSGMTATNLARGITNSDIKKVELLITNNCLQNSIENLAEWNDCMEYVLCTSSYLPDMGGDYGYFISHIDGMASMEELLKSYVDYIAPFFTQYHIANNIEFSTSISAIRMDKMPAVFENLNSIFDIMKSELDKTSLLTDYPCINGRTYKEGYNEALENTYGFDILKEKTTTRDLNQFLMNAHAYTGNVRLRQPIASFQEAIDSAILATHCYKTAKMEKASFNIYAFPEGCSDSILKIYSTSKFDKLTGWSELASQFIKQ